MRTFSSCADNDGSLRQCTVAWNKQLGASNRPTSEAQLRIVTEKFAPLEFSVC